MLLYFARHGESEDNANGIIGGRRDTKLTARGIRQAEALASFIQRTAIRPDVVYTSPLRRAADTADIITAKLNLPSAMRKTGLQERDFGAITGMTKLQANTVDTGGVIVAGKRRFAIAPKKAETFDDLLKRAERVLADLKSSHPNDKVLVVSHCVSGLMLFARYHGLDWRQVLKDYHFGNASLVLMSSTTRPEDAMRYVSEL